MKKGKRRLIIVLVVIAILVGGGYLAVTKLSQKAPVMMQPMSMGPRFEVVSKSQLREIISSTGIINLTDEPTVYGNTGSVISEVLVEVGDKVEEGQVIVTYDVEQTVKDLDKKIQEADINLQSSMIRLKSMELPATDSEKRQLQNSIESAKKTLADAEAALISTDARIEQKKLDIKNAEAAIEKAEENIRRAEEDIIKADENISVSQQLLDVGAITQEEHKQLEDKRQNVVDARDSAIDERDKAIENKDKTISESEDLLRQRESNLLNIDIAKKNLAEAEMKLSDATKVLSTEKERLDYETQKNQITLAELNLKQLQEQRADIVFETKSSYSGTVTAVNVQKGSTVDAKVGLIQLTDFNQLIVKANISEYDAPKLELGQSVSMTSDGLPGKVYEGQVIFIDNIAVSPQGVNETVVPIEISVTNADDKIKPGFNLDLEIIAVVLADVINISISAVQKDRESGKNYVYRIGSDNIIEKAFVELGIYGDMNVEVISGLNENDKIITVPDDTIVEGMPFEMPAEGGPGFGGNNQDIRSDEGVSAGDARGGGPKKVVIQR